VNALLRRPDREPHPPCGSGGYVAIPVLDLVRTKLRHIFVPSPAVIVVVVIGGGGGGSSSSSSSSSGVDPRALTCAADVIFVVVFVIDLHLHLAYGPSSPARGWVVVVVVIGALHNLRSPVGLGTPDGKGGRNAISIFLVWLLLFVNLDLENDGRGAGEKK
jgi:hypothetical protein